MSPVASCRSGLNESAAAEAAAGPHARSGRLRIASLNESAAAEAAAGKTRCRRSPRAGQASTKAPQPKLRRVKQTSSDIGDFGGLNESAAAEAAAGPRNGWASGPGRAGLNESAAAEAAAGTPSSGHDWCDPRSLNESAAAEAAAGSSSDARTRPKGQPQRKRRSRSCGGRWAGRPTSSASSSLNESAAAEAAAGGVGPHTSPDAAAGAASTKAPQPKLRRAGDTAGSPTPTTCLNESAAAEAAAGRTTRDGASGWPSLNESAAAEAAAGEGLMAAGAVAGVASTKAPQPKLRRASMNMDSSAPITPQRKRRSRSCGGLEVGGIDGVAAEASTKAPQPKLRRGNNAYTCSQAFPPQRKRRSRSCGGGEPAAADPDRRVASTKAPQPKLRRADRASLCRERHQASTKAPQPKLRRADLHILVRQRAVASTKAPQPKLRRAVELPSVP